MSKKRYIVTFEDPTTDIKGAAAVLQRAISTKTSAVKDGIAVLSSEAKLLDYENDVLHLEGIGCSVATLSEAQCEKLANAAGVAGVEEDIEVFALSEHRRAYEKDDAQKDDLQENTESESESPSRAPRRLVPPTPWNVQLVRAHTAWRRTTGRDVKLAIIDTGIDDDHPDLSVYGGASFVPGVATWNDDQGHGTHCAGIAAGRQSPGFIGVAPESSLFAIKVLSSAGSGRLSWIVAGMAWALQNNMNVMSMSLGSDVGAENAACSAAYQSAAQQLIGNGCIVIAAAGNAGNGPNHWVGQPARCPGYMAVASVDRNSRLSSFSSWGSSLGTLSNVEISAPGSSINSTRMGGGHRRMSGTSMACPHVAGAAALLKQQHPTWPPDRIRRRLKDTAGDLGAPGTDPKFGAGLLNCETAVFG